MSKVFLTKLFWLIFFLLPSGLWAQTLLRDKTSGKFYYSEEVLVKDGPQQDLYHRAKAWFASAGQNQKRLLKDDHANGILLGEISSKIPVSGGGKNPKFKLWYTVNLQLADDMYWVSLLDFQVQNLSLTKEINPAKETPVNKQPLEKWLESKQKVNSKEKKYNSRTELENAVYKIIFFQMKDLKSHML